MKSFARTPIACLVAVAALLAACATNVPPRGDALWWIVSRCLEPAEPDYCSRCFSPVEGSCGGDRGCLGTTQVWAETPAYVAIRDIKMCGCPRSFVHGLALSRSRVTGVEDPRRPAGIWAFAWEVARQRIPDEREIALAVNPPDRRTQNQLHVHLVRLAPGARAGVAARAPTPMASLDETWAVAARAAAAAGLADYGVLVVRDDANRGFLVLVDRESPESEFTVGSCH
jgi:CDP-diacylglycerol pyrophosphatase